MSIALIDPRASVGKKMSDQVLERGLFSEREAAAYMGAQLRDVNSLVRRKLLRRLEISPGVIRYAKAEIDAIIASDVLVSSAPDPVPVRPIDALAQRVQKFLAERCTIGIREMVPAAELAAAFNDWNGEAVPSYSFGVSLGRASAGIFKIRARSKRSIVSMYLGVTLRGRETPTA
ncbi:MAG: hypothetical protein JNL50_13555 [Phycisphaerae bacterium]|nr:hypothetical protein [Phycisphaerae bacterium]